MPIPIDIAKEAADPVLAGQDIRCLDRGDLMTLILQRSEIMFDRQGDAVIWQAAA